MKIGREEIFGPVLTVFKFKSVDKVVQTANDTKVGLYAGVWTNDLAFSQRLVNQLQAGVVALYDSLRRRLAATRIVA
jgi:aldehyde dehydrogenase (NAD+)